MPIQVSVSGGQQITASVGETQIDVSVPQSSPVAATVTGGVGPQGPQGPAGPSGLSTVAISGGTVSPLVLDITQQVAA